MKFFDSNNTLSNILSSIHLNLSTDITDLYPNRDVSKFSLFRILDDRRNDEYINSYPIEHEYYDPKYGHKIIIVLGSVQQGEDFVV